MSLLQDPELLEGRVTLHHVKAGSVVARQGDQVHTNFLNSNQQANYANRKTSAQANSRINSLGSPACRRRVRS